MLSGYTVAGLVYFSDMLSVEVFAIVFFVCAQMMVRLSIK